DRERPDRLGRLRIEDRPPRAAGVIGLPDAAVDRAGVEDVRLRRHARERARAPAAQRPDHPPRELLVDPRRTVLRDGDPREAPETGARRQEKESRPVDAHEAPPGVRGREYHRAEATAAAECA